MALSAATVWEVRTTGDDANSGGFVAGASGTDRSQSDTPHVTFDGSTITASNGGAGATITLSGYTVVAADVGNILKIAGGTNFTAGHYQIVSVDTGANTWTLDANVTSGAGSGMTGRMGGAKLTIDAAADAVVAGNTVYVKAGTYAEVVTTSVAGTAALPLKFIGYSSSRTDNGKATITGSNSRTRCIDVGSGATPYWWNNFILTAATSALIGGRDSTGWRFQNCEFYSGSSSIPMQTVIGGFTGTGFSFVNCLIRNLSALNIRCNYWFGNHIHDITSGGAISIPAFFGVSTAMFNLIHDITGWGMDSSNNSAPFFFGNTIYNCSSGGIRIHGTVPTNGTVLNNLIVSNGSVGIEVTNALSGDASLTVGHNAFFGQATVQNTARYNFYLGNDVNLSADPFTDAANDDYTLTDAALAEMDGFGFPNWFASPNLNHRAMGALQPEGGGSSEHAYTFVGG